MRWFLAALLGSCMALLCWAVAGFRRGTDSADVSRPVPAVVEDRTDAAHAVHAEAVPPARILVAGDPPAAPVGAVAHEHTRRPEEVRFDLSVPKEQRRFCASCDPFRAELASRFDARQQRLLERVAQFGAYTDSEVWRLAAAKPGNMAEIEARLGPLVSQYEVMGIACNEARSEFGRELIARGEYEEFPTMPEGNADGSQIVVSVAGPHGAAVFRRAILTHGRDAAYDAASAASEAALASLTAACTRVMQDLHAATLR